MRDAKHKGLIDNQTNVHSLRQSFATHLLESGTDIRYIQGFLGHSNIKTTAVYAHLTQAKVSSILSPLDSLGIKPPENTTSHNEEKTPEKLHEPSGIY